MKRSLFSVDFLVTMTLAIGVLAMLFWWPWTGALILVGAFFYMVVGIGIVTKLDQRVDGRLTLWLTDLDVQSIAAAVIACWPALLWIYRERGPLVESAPQR